MSIDSIMSKIGELLTGEQYESPETKRLLGEIETMIYDYGWDKYGQGYRADHGL